MSSKRTLHVRLGNDHVFALTPLEVEFLRKVIHTKGKTVHVSGSEIRRARHLAACGFGTLTDDGNLLLHGRVDGERYTFALADRTIQGA